MRTTLQALAVCLGALALALPASPLPASPLSAAPGTRKPLRLVQGEPARAGLPSYAARGDVQVFIDTLVERHRFLREDLETLFAQLRFNGAVARIMATQTTPVAGPPPLRDWNAYRARFLEPVRVGAGVQFWRAHAATLARAEEDFGIPAEVIVGILGVETIFGRNPGSFRVVEALATLAFDYPPTAKVDRSAFFRGQLEEYLLFVREQGLDAFALRGSYAGAIGIPQFMPGSYRRFAVDYDGDGRIDLRASADDAIGSVANFLMQHGWRRGEPIVFPATVPPQAAALADGGLDPHYTLGELEGAGIRATDPRAGAGPLGIVDLPNGQDPPTYLLGAPNFFVLTQYNRSYFYAASVLELGAAVRAAAQP